MIATAKPPGPRNPPIIGHLRAFRSNPVKFLLKLQAEFGDLVHFRAGPVRAYFFNDPEWIKDILVTRQGLFTKSRILQRARVLLGEGLLTSEGAFHMRQRRLVQPAFHRDRLIGYAATMGEYAVRARERWRDGAVVNVADEMMRVTLAIVGKTLFSADIQSEATEIGKALTDVLAMFDVLVLPFSEYFQKLPIAPVRRFERARATLDSIIYRLISERRASGKDYGDLLSMLLLSVDEDEDGSGMNDQQVRDEALTLILAGHETTANALTWTWYLLSQNPSCAARLQAEVDEVIGDRTPVFDDFPNLRYTEMVLAESMRFYPPAWGVGRSPKEDIEIAGI
ncbi:MAG: cytochrome P450, partial [Acidobacteriaceae bacterium]|nr:cytochrome P450 [Acidobacteriaceae bacterium]